jgi:hypothetical protein
LESWLGKEIVQQLNRLRAAFLSWLRAITQSSLEKTWNCHMAAADCWGRRPALTRRKKLLLPWNEELNKLAGEERNVQGLV